MGNRILAGASSFAHLVGLARPSAETEEDEQKKKDAAAKKKAEEEEREKEEAAAAVAAAAAGARVEEDDDEQKKKDAAAAKKKAEDEEKEREASESDDDEEEMRGKSAASNARRRERARCAAIFASPDAAHNVALAASLAFETTLTRKEALSVLSKAPAASAPLAAGRAARNPTLGPSGDATVTSKQAIAKSWDAAAAKVPSLKRR